MPGSDPWCPIERWEPWPWDKPDTVLGASGPESTLLEDPDMAPDTMPTSRPAGFVRNG